MNATQAFALLKLPHNATVAEIKRSYHALCKEYHPDKNTASDAAATFAKIKEAYEQCLKIAASPPSSCFSPVTPIQKPTRTPPFKPKTYTDMTLKLDVAKFYCGGTFRYNYKYGRYNKLARENVDDTVLITLPERCDPYVVYEFEGKGSENGPFDKERSILRVTVSPKESSNESWMFTDRGELIRHLHLPLNDVVTHTTLEVLMPDEGYISIPMPVDNGRYVLIDHYAKRIQRVVVAIHIIVNLPELIETLRDAQQVAKDMEELIK